MTAPRPPADDAATAERPDGPDVCPHCDAALAYYVDEQRYSRVLGVEVRGVYDGVLYFACPDCHTAWHRWPPGHPIRERAERYRARHNRASR